MHSGRGLGGGVEEWGWGVVCHSRWFMGGLTGTGSLPAGWQPVKPIPANRCKCRVSWKINFGKPYLFWRMSRESHISEKNKFNICKICCNEDWRCIAFIWISWYICHIVSLRSVKWCYIKVSCLVVPRIGLNNVNNQLADGIAHLRMPGS